MNKFATIAVALLVALVSTVSAAERSEEFFRGIMATQLESLTKVEVPSTLEEAAEHFLARPIGELTRKNILKYIEDLDEEDREDLKYDALTYMEESAKAGGLIALADDLSIEELKDYNEWLNKLDYSDPGRVKILPLTISLHYIESM